MQARAATTTQKLALLTSLYLAQGLPFGFFSKALPALLADRHVSLEKIGASSLLFVPWALKFVWAPVVDTYWSARFGRRRTWIVPLQLTAVLVCIAFGTVNALDHLGLLAVFVLTLSFLAATQDIPTDGLAVDILAPSERGLGNGIQVAGYRVGMVIGGGALLIAYQHLGWTRTMVTMAAILALTTIPIVRFREPPVVRGDSAPGVPPYRDANGPPRKFAVGSMRHFFRRHAARWLVMVALFKFGDAAASSMIVPFVYRRLHSYASIGWMLGTVGAISGLVGALLGGALVNRLGRRRALITFGTIQAVSVGCYAIAAAGSPGETLLTVLAAFEHVAGGMATTALFTAMMDVCREDTSATDYTVQASVQVIAQFPAGVLAGWIAQRYGFSACFTVAAVLCVIAVIDAATGYRRAFEGITGRRPSSLEVVHAAET